MKPKDLKFPHRWEERRPEISNGVLFIPNYYDRHTEWSLPSWSSIFGNDKPVAIEYCTGNGTWILEKARDNTKNWIAVEKKFERVRKIWSKMKNHGLKNLFIVCGQAETLASIYLPPHSIDEAFINFPDPWPKEKHAKNRLFQTPFVENLARTIKPSGTLTAVTDDPAYSEQIFREMTSCPSWKSRFQEPGFVTEWEGYGTSYFDTLWREKGKVIRYFQFNRR